jgi:chromosome segregation ATPase
VALPEALGFAAAPVSRELRVVRGPDPEEAERARREEALARARETLEAAQREHEEARTQVSALEARALQVSAELEEARRRVADLEARAEEVDDELAEAEDARDAAAEELAGAQAEVDRLTR